MVRRPAIHTYRASGSVTLLVSEPAGPNWRLKLLAAKERHTFEERNGQAVTQRN